MNGRKSKDNAGEASLNIYKAIFKNSIDAIFITTPDGGIQSANPAACKMFGYTEEEIKKAGRNGVLDMTDDRIRGLLKERERTGKFSGEIRHKRKDGSVFPADFSSTVFKFEKDREHTITIVRDITLQKEADHLLSSSNELLGIINRASSKIDLIKSVTGFLRNTFGFEAVGIRLKEGDDFPYYQTSGFPEAFVMKEKSLCSYNKEGEILYDSDGNPVLECMCGNVICGRYDPAKPFFTENGSFWTNSTSELLASTSEDDRQSRTRNRCHGEGYESVGLFPLRSGNTTCGLLQVNDRRKGVFNPARISVLEIIGDNISIAIDKFNAEEALKKSEDKIRMLVSLSPAGIYMTDEGGKCTFVNKAWCMMAGMEPDEAYGDGWINAIHPADRAYVSGLWDKYVNSGREWNWNYRFIDKKGVVSWVFGLSKPILDASGKTIGFIGTNTDITDLKLAEENLKHSEEKFRLLSEQSGAGVGLYSKDGIILYYNSRAIKNLGGRLEDFVGKSVQEVFGKKDGTKYLKKMKEVIRLEKSLVFEDHFSSPAGNYWFASSHSPISDSNGEVIGVQVVSHDITERKLIETQLIQTTTELRELTRHMVEVREEERTSIAHDLHDDLGQKLTALNMDLSWLKARIGVQSRTVENKIKQMALQMEDTIDSVQKISFGLRPSILDDLGLVPAIEWLLTDFHKSSGLSCTFSRSPNNILVDARISLVVFRIIQEALTNIARHSGATKVNIKLSMTNGILEISVKDNGSGITQEKIDSNKSFGLIGMKERVNFVNGDVSISGRQGEGTRVHVSIPVGR